MFTGSPRLLAPILRLGAYCSSPSSVVARALCCMPSPFSFSYVSCFSPAVTIKITRSSSLQKMYEKTFYNRNMKWLPKQFVLWGTNILQAVAICSSALSTALMMRSSTCLISTRTDKLRDDSSVIFKNSTKRVLIWSEGKEQSMGSDIQLQTGSVLLYIISALHSNKKRKRWKGRERGKKKWRFHSHVVSFPSCFKYLNTALILHLFP